MMNIKKYTLKNGLKLVFHKDEKTPLVAVNLLYDVGSKDENPNKTGFAHLFEHLMFGGSKNIPDYDNALEKVGAENNAFTSNDFTNYYIIIPKENLETAFWLESDRMKELDFSEKKLKIQQNVVIEEFKQTHLNQPYGDLWLIFRPFIYEKHSYRWTTIGKEISHIEKINLEDVKDFFYKYYAPNNAILSVVGNLDFEELKILTEKWFGDIEKRNVPLRNLEEEPKQIKEKNFSVKKDVPYDLICKTFHMCRRDHKDFQKIDIISDILSNGKSSRMYQNLVKEKKIFSNLDAYVTGHLENGLFVIYGNLMKNVKMEVAEAEICKELKNLKEKEVGEYELQKIKNKLESNMLFSQINLTEKASIEKYEKISAKDIKETAIQLFRKENSNTIYYYAK
ncbi:MAG: peptidase M16 [Bacteroidetes bacterium 4572_128]|nr:MAG: peptidase M16 [Bacteroidetes bacterium 4572_128]